MVSLFLLALTATTVRAMDGQVSESRASSHAVVYGTVWGHTLAQDGSGFYNEIAADLLAGGEEGGVSYKPMPYRRARAQFLDSRNSCLYPSAQSVLEAGGHLPKGTRLIETDPLFAAHEYLFSASGQVPPSGMAELKGKTIAVPSGSIMLTMLKHTGAKLISVHDETDKAQMLITGRVDLMSGMLPNEHIVFHDLGAAMPTYDAGFQLLDAGVAVVCHDTAENRALIERLNRRIADLKREPGFRGRLMAAGIADLPEMGADDLNRITPAAGGAGPRFSPPGRRLPFSNIR